MGESFRAGVGAVILDAAGQVLAFERTDVEAAAWQLPQGGLERGEAPLAAVFREVEEETGLTRDELELVAQLEEPLAYELPLAMRTQKTGRGQVGYWFFFRARAEPRLPAHGEFRAWRPLGFGELIEATVAFRKPVYRRLAEYFEAEVRKKLL